MPTRAKCTLLVAGLVSGLVACGDSEQPSQVQPAASAAPVASSGRMNNIDLLQIAGAELPYAEVEGELARGYFSYPVDMVEPLPAIIVIHDQYGLNENFKRVADQVAGLGYVAVAVDLFDGATGKVPADTREASIKLLEKPEFGRTNLAQAIEFVETSFGSTEFAVIGWGSGGLWALNTASVFTDKINAVVVVQGQTITSAEFLATLTMPLLGVYGANDPGVNTAAVTAFREALSAAEVVFETRVYPVAGSGFMLPDSRSYDRAKAANAWELMAGFLRSNLSSSMAQ